MARYKSVDALQNTLAATVFKDTTSAKKAAGRALGTLVELITFYMIRDWDLEDSLAIERGLPEYGNQDITHNVEFSLHPASATKVVSILDQSKTLTAAQIRLSCEQAGIEIDRKQLKSTKLLKGDELRHAAVFAEDEKGFWTANKVGRNSQMRVTHLDEHPYAMFECKRVGVEEGMKKGPQTIEKAKQGAYVARTVSGLQRVPKQDGSVAAVLEQSDGEIVTHPSYYTFLWQAIEAEDRQKLSNIVLTVGIVSNHGNWFTADTQNKEMRVLAQSYDWLLFLTDDGLAEFIEVVLQGDQDEFAATREAFRTSFGQQQGKTKFTKVTLNADADQELTNFFHTNKPWDRWFNVIAPAPGQHLPAREAEVEELDADDLERVGERVSLGELRSALHRLRIIHSS